MHAYIYIYIFTNINNIGAHHWSSCNFYEERSTQTIQAFDDNPSQNMLIIR